MIIIKKNFSWINKEIKHFSWHSFNYHIDNSLLTVLEKEIKKIVNQNFNFILRFHPDLKKDLKSILTGNVINDGEKLSCFAPTCRMAIWANGDVSFCGDFPEFCIDNLANNDVKSLWKNEDFNRIRKIFNSVPKPISLCQRCRFSYGNLT
jgi:radical SAM protein with 4Fe4S-binding SPASM domain